MSQKEGTYFSQKLACPLRNWMTGRRCNLHLSAMHGLQSMSVEMLPLGVHVLAHAWLPPCCLFMTLHMDKK